MTGRYIAPVESAPVPRGGHAARPVSRLITAVVGWAVTVFHEVERRGDPIPDGPVLVVANHLNSLLDPLVLFRVAGRPTRPLAKAPLFQQVFVGGMLRGLGGLPVYRKQDDEALMGRNENTFRAAIEALRAGDALQIYPEGKSHSEPGLEPLRTGAARIALAAEAESGGRQGLRIVPVGLTYERKHLFGGRVLAEIGEPFEVMPWLTPAGASDPEAVRALTETIAERLRALTLNLTEHGDRALLEAADRIWSREKGVHGYRERDALADRVPRLRVFARALAWLRGEDPARYRRLASAVRRHEALARMLGAEEGEVPDRYQRGATARYVVREGAAILLGMPLAVAGIVLWYPTWVAPRLTLRLVKPDHESIATYKLATGFLMAPLTIAACAIAGLLYAGWPGAAAGLILAPVVGLAALAWRTRWSRVREDTRLFFRVLGRGRTRERMAERRRTLVAEFDDVLARMDASPPPGPSAGAQPCPQPMT